MDCPETIRYSLTVIRTFTRIAFNDSISFFGRAIILGFGEDPQQACEQSELFLLAKTWLAT